MKQTLDKQPMTYEDDKLAFWMSAALEDSQVCDKMKRDIREWFASFSGPYKV